MSQGTEFIADKSVAKRCVEHESDGSGASGTDDDSIEESLLPNVIIHSEQDRTYIDMLRLFVSPENVRHVYSWPLGVGAKEERQI